ncbi:hypothetical protein [Spirosoma radiotolerans]|uniref:Uncharacterized protein n=1 Tax=Spirosoma radiotolerans TaxID=1379870 RepID=A0A0E3V4R5_9BACT|nr:hypothetical protein [Spirosoma radiotolerans]AKD53532.1 hypothetical protein SD10_00060 [Spirosoma radiotolerans]
MNYGTLTNLIYAEDKPADPKIGDGATLLQWSNRHACTVIEVKKNYVLVTRDIAERTDQNFEKGPQEYAYQLDPDATPVRANLRKEGKYYIGNQALKIGYRNEHYDYTF